MKTYPTIDEAITAARIKRDTCRRHFSVNQRRNGVYVVVDQRQCSRPVWSTYRDGVKYRKILPEDVPLILSLLAENITVSETARKFDVDRRTIRNIRDKYS